MNLCLSRLINIAVQTLLIHMHTEAGSTLGAVTVVATKQVPHYVVCDDTQLNDHGLKLPPILKFSNVRGI